MITEAITVVLKKIRGEKNKQIILPYFDELALQAIYWDNPDEHGEITDYYWVDDEVYGVILTRQDGSTITYTEEEGIWEPLSPE